MTTQKHLIIAEVIVNLLEHKFKIFNRRFGLDPLIGLIPVVGDVVPYILSFYFIYIAIRSNIPIKTLLKMIFYSTLDFVLGAIPFVGDYVDFIYHGQLKSFNVLKKYMDEKSDAMDVTAI